MFPCSPKEWTFSPTISFSLTKLKIYRGSESD